MSAHNEKRCSLKRKEDRMRWCDNCGGVAGQKKTFTDLRRQSKTVELHICSDECASAIEIDLAQKARAAGK